MDTGDAWFIPVRSKQGCELMSPHLLLTPRLSMDGSLKPAVVVETFMSWHREDQDAGIFGKAKGVRCKDMEVLVWPMCELQPTLKKSLCSV